MDEANADWWTGKCRGRQGLFPSNHVEILNSPAPTSPAPAFSPVYSSPTGPPQPIMPPGPAPAPTPQYSPTYGDPKPVYRPFGAVYQQQDQPPPPGQMNSVGLQQAPEQEKKKSKFGRLGETVSNKSTLSSVILSLICHHYTDGHFCSWRCWFRSG